MLAAGLLVLAGLPAVAAARPTVQIVGSGSTKTLNYEAGSLDGQNDPRFTISGTNFRIAEFGGGSPQRIDAGPGCSSESDTVALCPTSGVVRINVTTKGGGDDVQMSTIAVAARVDLGEDTDSVATGAGNDTLIGGDGSDGLSGGPGNDTLHGDQLDGGGNGDDNLLGRAGNDVLKAGKGDDDLDGGDQDDTLDGGFDGDDMVGGPGIDTADYSSRTKGVRVSLVGGPSDNGNEDDGAVTLARDHINFDVENAIGGSGPDSLSGNRASNRLNGRGGADDLGGSLGDDTLIGSTGADDLRGGTGEEVSGDVASYADHAAAVTVTIGDNCCGSGNDGNSVDQTGFRRDNVFADVEGVLGSPGDDDMTGDENPNTFDGGAGADTFNGLGGIDTFSYASHSAGVTVTLGDGVANEGNSSDDSTAGTGARDRIPLDVEAVAGGPGNDNLTGDGNANTFQGNAGVDTLDGAAGNDSLDGGPFPDTLIGGPGAADEVTYASRASGVVVTLDDIRNDGNFDDRPPIVGSTAPADNVQSSVENVIGSQGIDRLVGSGASNTLDGQGGSDAALVGLAGGDSLLGGDGDDALEGSGGDDILDGQDGADVLDGGDGSDVMNGGGFEFGPDVVDYSDRTTPIDVTLGNTTTAGVPSDDGGAEDGPLTQRDGILNVEDVIGGSADDRIIDAVLQVPNRFVGGPGNDQLETGLGNDVLEGDAGDDQLAGGENVDRLDGGIGADLISGGPGVGDVADYGPRSDAVTVILNNAPNDGNAEDGPAGARDNVTDDIEDVIGGSGPDTLEGDADANVLEGGEGADTLRGRSGGDELSGGGADDLLLGGDDADTMSGGEGSDTVSYSGRTDAVSVNLSEPDSTNQGGLRDGVDGARDTIADVENVTGGNAGDALIGSAAANVLLGREGGDTIDSGIPDPVGGIPQDVDGDQVKGEGGNDKIDSVDGANDDVSCGTGTDKATVDLKDTPGGKIADCEDFTRLAVDQYPGVRISRPKLLIDEQELLVHLGCPRKSPDPFCNGKLSARTLTIVESEEPPAEQPPEGSEEIPPPEPLASFAEPGPKLDSHRYRVRSGRREAVHLSLSQADVNRILEAKWIRLRARELDPLGRPKLTSRDCATGHQDGPCRIRVLGRP